MNASLVPSGPNPAAMRTAWSFILQAQGRQEASVIRQRCMDYLAARYWQPVFVFIRKSGHSEEESLDLTQSYFATFMEKNYLDQVSPERGRLRNFICSSVKNFICNWHDHAKATKRRPKGKLLALDLGAEAGALPVPSASATPDEAYMREWARSTMTCAIEAMAEACREEGLTEYWEVFRRHVSEATQFENPSYEQTAASLNWGVEKVRKTLHHARRKFAAVVRDVLRESLENEADIESELNDLRRYFVARGS